MIKTILVPATGHESDLVTFKAGASVARAFEAHLDVLHVRLDPVEVAARLTADLAGAPLAGNLIETLERDASECEIRSRRLFESFCSGEGLPIRDTPPAGPEGISAQWHVETGDEARVLASYGLTADLLVAGRGTDGQATSRPILAAALLETGRPMLIPSSGPMPMSVVDTIAIAWKSMPQSARAVAAAMPFLQHAANVIVMTVEESAPHKDVERVVRNLAWHGIRARKEHLVPKGRENPVDTLLARVSESIGLLVMGGYGHSRVRELIFGGFTERVLNDAPLPVLMTH